MHGSETPSKCPMCGADPGFARLTCPACGESLAEGIDGNEEYIGGISAYSRRWARTTGFFTAGLGAIVTLMGGWGIWDFLANAGHDGLGLACGALLAGLGWLIGGGLLYCGRSAGYWLAQPINAALLVRQLVRVDKLNPQMSVLTGIFTFLCQRTRTVLIEAESSSPA